MKPFQLKTNEGILRLIHFEWDAVGSKMFSEVGQKVKVEVKKVGSQQNIVLVTG